MYAHAAVMDFDTFSARSRAIANGIPEEFLEGIDTVDVHRDAMPHPHVPDIYTLGECATSHLSDPTGQEPFRSIIHLYYGSFLALAERDPAFDVETEIRETIEHEIQHHLEDRAGEEALRNEDALFEAHARFRAGMDVPAGWYRHGDVIAPRLWAVDLDVFLELELLKRDWDGILGTRVVLNLPDGELEVDVPRDAAPDEIWVFEGDGLSERDALDDAGEDADDEPPPGLDGDFYVVPIVR